MRVGDAASREEFHGWGIPYQFVLGLQSKVLLARPVGWLAQPFCRISTALVQTAF